MPSFFKHSNSNAKGVQKVAPIIHKLKPTLLKKTQHCLNYFMPQGWFIAPNPSTVFESNDCIWYYGTLYVKEAVAVQQLQQQQLQQQPATVETLGATATATSQMEQTATVTATATATDAVTATATATATATDADHAFDDDDTESISSGNGGISAFKTSRSIGKQNQLKYLKDGMQLRHIVQLNQHEWFATFDAETNRIIRTPDGVAFDTLRQFARLHCNEVLSVDSSSTNVWSDPHFQYKDADHDAWHPLSNLKH
jgi:hypothetical protein